MQKPSVLDATFLTAVLFAFGATGCATLKASDRSPSGDTKLKLRAEEHLVPITKTDYLEVHNGQRDAIARDQAAEGVCADWFAKRGDELTKSGERVWGHRAVAGSRGSRGSETYAVSCVLQLIDARTYQHSPASFIDLRARRLADEKCIDLPRFGQIKLSSVTQLVKAEDEPYLQFSGSIAYERPKAGPVSGHFHVTSDLATDKDVIYDANGGAIGIRLRHFYRETRAKTRDQSACTFEGAGEILVYDRPWEINGTSSAIWMTDSPNAYYDCGTHHKWNKSVVAPNEAALKPVASCES